MSVSDLELLHGERDEHRMKEIKKIFAEVENRRRNHDKHQRAHVQREADKHDADQKKVRFLFSRAHSCFGISCVRTFLN